MEFNAALWLLRNFQIGVTRHPNTCQRSCSKGSGLDSGSSFSFNIFQLFMANPVYSSSYFWWIMPAPTILFGPVLFGINSVLSVLCSARALLAKDFSSGFDRSKNCTIGLHNFCNLFLFAFTVAPLWLSGVPNWPFRCFDATNISLNSSFLPLVYASVSFAQTDTFIKHLKLQTSALQFREEKFDR